ncbi:hypothetical protein ACFRAA_22185 [[Kitasatospora] papulosa]|uniref:hypothetical protein n=1 Tax=[Kitasatospora] papulosa TaxID=1464011 RepID=UPI0036283268
MEEVGADAVSDRGDGFAAVSAGVYVGALRPRAIGTGHATGFSDLGHFGARGEERGQAFARISHQWCAVGGVLRGNVQLDGAHVDVVVGAVVRRVGHRGRVTGRGLAIPACTV